MSPISKKRREKNLCRQLWINKRQYFVLSDGYIFKRTASKCIESIEKYKMEQVFLSDVDLLSGYKTPGLILYFLYLTYLLLRATVLSKSAAAKQNLK